MKSGRIAVGAMAILLAMTMFSCGQPDTEMDMEQTQEDVVALSGAPTEILTIPPEVEVDSPMLENKKEERREDYLVINLQLPVLTGTRADTEINDIIEKEKTDKVIEIEEWAKLMKSEAEQGAEYVISGKSELISIWDYTEQGNFVSLIIEWSQYAGGVHEDYYNKMYTFDKETGRVYSLKDLFSSQEGVDYITNYITTDIKNNPDMYMDYALEDLISYDGDYDFYINGDCITIVFPPYDLKSFSDGVTVFEIKAEDLKKWLLPEAYEAMKDKPQKEINSFVICKAE